MLDTGFDCPEVVNLVMARFTKSGVLYRQMRGRGTRKADHIRKANFTMFDFVGNCDFHDDEEPLPGGVVVVEAEEPEARASRAGCWPWTSTTRSIPTTREWVVYEADGTVAALDRRRGACRAAGRAIEAFLAGRGLDGRAGPAGGHDRRADQAETQPTCSF